jgi:hypothetical protein
VVGDAVAFDREDHPAGLGGVLGDVVDPIAGAPPLGDERDPGLDELGLDVAFEGVEVRFVPGGVAEVRSAGLGVGEVPAEHLCSFGP